VVCFEAAVFQETRLASAGGEILRDFPPYFLHANCPGPATPVSEGFQLALDGFPGEAERA
jgi:hypothetical protein